MAEDEFYVEDETPDEVRAAIKRGEKGQTVGKKDLNQRSKSIVDRAVARLEQDDGPSFRLTLVSRSVAETEKVDETIRGAQSADLTDRLEYQAG
jgi:hypothetical protein